MLGLIILQPERNNTCGMCIGAISKELDKIVEFSAFEDFISFERKGKNKVKRVEKLFARKLTNAYVKSCSM
jgi:hypothetical protein